MGKCWLHTTILKADSLNQPTVTVDFLTWPPSILAITALTTVKIADINTNRETIRNISRELFNYN